VNIEGAFHEAMEEQGEGGDYTSFPGICLTDTFLMSEKESFTSDLFGDNGKRVKHVSKQNIRVIIANPPYSIGQKSANDNNQNQSYPDLDGRIANTYAAESESNLLKGLYDSYIRAFRWASDRITDDGIVAYVTNGSFIEKGSMDGFRKCLMNEFSDIYCFNLRGGIRGKTREDSRREGQNVFNIMTGVAITILVKKKGYQGEAKLHYHDIGDYLSREEKLDIIKNHGTIRNMEWQNIVPDKHGDWINHRDDSYNAFLPMGDKETKGKDKCKAIFGTFSLGVATNRDVWAYNFSQEALNKNMQKTIAFFNENLGKDPVYSKTDIVWTDLVLKAHQNGRRRYFTVQNAREGLYRPFCKSNLYFDKEWNQRQYQLPTIFPTQQHENLVICLPSVGARQSFTCIITDQTPDLHIYSDGAQCFPLYVYEKSDPDENTLGLDLIGRKGDYVRRPGITTHALKQFRTAYGNINISQEDIFYYIYAVLHSPQYREKYGNNLKKELPRIPFLKEFRRWSEAGRELAKWHLNYETVEPWPVKEEGVLGFMGYRVEKMAFPKKGQRDSIIYNRDITLTGIPEEAYEYIVNGKSAIEWVMERYQVKTDKDSGILNDPNAWCDEHKDPRYIIDLVKRVVRVSMESMKVIKGLPVPEEL
jgi:predicted helicase